MDSSTLARTRAWFEAYTAPFRCTDPEGLRNIDLKIAHTGRVCQVMDQLTAGENLPANTRLIAAMTALLHDVGRFPQYQQWRTFRDSDSDNHARLSIEVIREQRVLHALPEAEQLLIEEAVRFHNLLELPETVKSPTRLFLQLIRDADKLDIWRVFLDLDALDDDERASAAGLGLPDLPEITPACLEALEAQRVVRLDQCRVLNDFKLLQISWALDLWFSTSYRMLVERDYIPRLAKTLHGPVDISAQRDRLMAEVIRRAA